LRFVQPEELEHGLWRWTAPHPEWKPGTSDTADDWSRDVGCALFQTSSMVLFIDPLLPPSTSPFWRWADERCAGRSVTVFTTIAYHRRSRDAIVARYGAASYGGDGDGETDVRRLPGGVQLLPVEGFGETLVWLASARTLLTGDSLLGDGRGGLRLCPESWLEDAPAPITLADLRDRLSPVLSLPIERVLVSHGEPVLSDGRRALARALEAIPVPRRH
jgi:glyoxylase-like metal-dependent hydrolase (beta-lactamase superfamily II)